MIAMFLLPVFLISQSWVVFWLLKWMKACGGIGTARWFRIGVCAVYFVCVLSMYIALLLPHGKIEKFFRVIGYYWYGISVYIFLFFLIMQLIRLIVKHSPLRTHNLVTDTRTFVAAGAICILAVIITCVWGHINAKNIHTTSYEVNIAKECDLEELNVVLIADQHLGYNIGADMMEQMVEKVNACKPDVVVVGGDVFDNCFANIEEPDRVAEILKGIESKYGVYATLGNHDCEEEIVGGFTFPSKEKKTASDGMYEFLEKSNFKLLCDESVLLEDSVYLYGRPDEERPGRYVEEERLSPAELMETMDTSKPVIVFEHEPKFLDELAEAKIDLHLAGHTHDGQLFPLSIATDIMWENACGYLQKGDMVSIVTSGVGLYGPFIRVGTIAEICNIHVTFQK